MRNTKKYRKREINFNNSFKINQNYLPQYNPIKDPYLQDFFRNNQLKKYLKAMSRPKLSKKDYGIIANIRPCTTREWRRNSQNNIRMKQNRGSTSSKEQIRLQLPSFANDDDTKKLLTTQFNRKYMPKIINNSQPYFNGKKYCSKSTKKQIDEFF